MGGLGYHTAVCDDKLGNDAWFGLAQMHSVAWGNG